MLKPSFGEHLAGQRASNHAPEAPPQVWDTRRHRGEQALKWTGTIVTPERRSRRILRHPVQPGAVEDVLGVLLQFPE